MLDIDKLLEGMVYKGENPGKSPFPPFPPLPEELKDDGPEPQHPYLVPIPNGYQFCPECELLTPHTLNSQVNPSKAYPEDWTCDVCDHEKLANGYECPRCGWEHDPERDLSPVSIKIKKHITACWNIQQKTEDDLGETCNWMGETCNCPEVDAYPIQKIFNYRSSSPQNMECSNAMEWSYDVMCNVCNYVFEVEDGNC